MPLPVTLKNILRPAVDENAEANALPDLIFKCIAQYGYTNSQGAREEMGEFAWSIVQGFGGWYHLCTSENLGSNSTIRAQMRDAARAMITRKQQGRDQLKPGQGITALIPNNKIDSPNQEIENKQLKKISEISSKVKTL
jgi:hypothetical protein